MTGFFQSIVTIALFILILGVLVVIHELGHFFTARAFRVRVLEFGIGFPPRAKVMRSKGETVYTLNWLPIGGFVKLEGEDGTDADDPRSFAAQRYLTKIVILVAGVAMNVLARVRHLHRHRAVRRPDGGHRGRWRPGRIAGRDGRDRRRRHDRRRSTARLRGVRSAVAARWPQVERRRDRHARASSRRRDGRAGPGHPPTGEPDRRPARRARHRAIEGRGPGRPAPLQRRRGDPDRRPAHGRRARADRRRTGHARRTRSSTARPRRRRVRARSGSRPRSATSSGSSGRSFTLYVAGILSANLAVVNILPFPPLDGGRMLMITLKRFFGARISVRAEQLTYMVGFVFLFAFLIWITGFDIVARPRRRILTASMSSPDALRPRRRADRQRRRRRRPRRARPTRSSSSR